MFPDSGPHLLFHPGITFMVPINISSNLTVALLTWKTKYHKSAVEAITGWDPRRYNRHKTTVHKTKTTSLYVTVDFSLFPWNPWSFQQTLIGDMLLPFLFFPSFFLKRTNFCLFASFWLVILSARGKTVRTNKPKRTISHLQLARTRKWRSRELKGNFNGSR